MPPTSVLIVDDDPVFLTLATKMIESIGATVVAAVGTAEAALDAAHALRPDAALVDVGLPDRGGLDLARELSRLSWAPRVVITSSDRDAAPHDGTPPFVPKEDLPVAPLRRLLLAE
jgi:CheY-like chemotaxis protein